MTTLLASIQQLLDSGNIDGAREDAARAIANFNAIDVNLRDFAALLALGSQPALEISLGALGRELLKRDEAVESEAIWLLLAAVLSRRDISTDSPSRISIIGLISSAKDWQSPLFALLTPALDSFFKINLARGNSLIAEQTLDFIANEEVGYAAIPRTKQQLHELTSLAKSVLDKVDDLDIKDEWDEGLTTFVRVAKEAQYSDRNIWSAALDLLKQIYPSRVLSSAGEMKKDYLQTQNQIQQFITSSLAAWGTISDGKGLTVAVRIDSLEKDRNFWELVASAIDRLERFFQEVADLTFDKLVKLPTFIPDRATPGSWSILLHMNLNSSKQSTALASAILALASTESSPNTSKLDLVDSWQDCAAYLKKNGLRVDFAVSTNSPNLHLVKTISTEDIDLLSSEKTSPNNIRILSGEVPQADNLDRILDFAALLIEYPSSASRIRHRFLEIEGISPRQFAYYRRAVEILGLADERQRPTNACLTLNRLQKPEQKMRLLAYQFLSSNIGSAWLKWQNASDLSEIKPDTAMMFLKTVCPSLSEETVKRRAKTLQAWLKIFIQYW